MLESTCSWRTSSNQFRDISHSPFASMIGTNHIPTISELNQLRDLLVSPRTELLRLDSEIHRIQSILDGLFQEKQQIQRFVDAHKALMSPVRQLPSETLSEIFKWCLPTDPPYAVRNIYQAPLVLTTICRTWRDTAYNTPGLWNSLHMYLPPHLSRDACSERINGITRWLKRSGSLPLFISFHGSTTLTSELPSIPCFPDQNMESMMHTLMQFSHRFSELYLSLSLPNFSTFFNLAPSRFPVLRSLQVRDEDFYRGKIRSLELEVEQMHRSNFSALLSRMPALQELQLHKFTVVDNNHSSLPCNWGHITKLEILATLDPNQVLTILSSTPKMQSITLSIGVSTPHTFHDLTAIHLSHLTEMKVTFLRLFTQVSTTMQRPDVVSAFEAEMTSIINCIQCTALRSLSFLCHHVLLSRLPFIGLPLHALETLQLTMPLTPEMMAECISNTPNLVNFQLTDLDDVSTGPQLHADPLQDLYLSKLTPSPTVPTPVWWPKIQNIRILSRLMSPYAYRYANAFSPTTFTSFIKHRSEYIPRLKSCDILFRQRPAFSEDELETLRNLKKNGLKLRLNGARCPSVWEFGPDSPDTGLVEPPNVSKLSDMECVFGTDILV